MIALRSKTLALLAGLLLAACADVGSSESTGQPDVLDASGTAEELPGPGPDIPDSTAPAPDPGPADPGPGIEDGEEPAPDNGPTDISAPEDGLPDGGAGDAGPELPQPPVDGGDPDADAGGLPDKCDDDDPCTEDSFDGEECVHTYVYGICCTANPHCNDGDVCTDDICLNGFCTHEPSCCGKNADCVDDTECTMDACEDGICVHQPAGGEGCCEEGIFAQSFDDGDLGGLVIQNSDDTTGWHVSDFEASSPPAALWYGNPLSQNYDNGIANSGTVTLPIIDLPAGVETLLKFSVYLDVEYGTYYDQLRVEVGEVGVSQPFVAWDKSKTWIYGGWVATQVDLTAFAGKAVVIVFVFETGDAEDNTKKGIFIDDLEITSSCAAKTCFSDPDCDDQLGATVDICVGAVPEESVSGICAYKPSSNYCTEYSECDDGEPCTYNSCSENECTYTENTNCCLSDEECTDTDPCTIDDCSGAYGTNGGYCQHIPKPDCCKPEDPTSCDDGDKCTADACPGAGESCQHVPIPSCCNQHEECDDGQPCTEDLCVQGACQSAVICCASPAACDDGDDACTEDACVDGLCQHSFVDGPGCCKVSVHFSSFVGPSLSMWSVVAPPDAPAPGPTDAVWQAVSTPSWSAGGALAFRNEAGTYDTGATAQGAVDSPEITLPSTTISQTSFWLHLDNEYANGLGSIEWDRLRVWAYRVDKPEPMLLLWDSADGEPVWWSGADAPTGPKWTHIEGLDLTLFKGRTIRLRVGFDSIDTDANAFGGPSIDDFQVVSTCGP